MLQLPLFALRNKLCRGSKTGRDCFVIYGCSATSAVYMEGEVPNRNALQVSQSSILRGEVRLSAGCAGYSFETLVHMAEAEVFHSEAGVGVLGLDPALQTTMPGRAVCDML